MPWRNLQSLIEGGLVKSGDTIYLFPGYYNLLTIYKNNKLSETKIVSISKHKAVFSKIMIRESENWTLDGVKVLKDLNTPSNARNLVDIETGSKNITVKNSIVLSAEDSLGWGVKEWNDRVKSGIFSRGTNVTILNNAVYNVDFGISMVGKKSTVLGNRVTDFSGDGLRGLGDESVFEENVVTNCHSVNQNHDDGFQSWSMDDKWNVGVSVVKNVSLKRNVFIANETKNNFPNCEMQGIGLFDGMFENWVIENNIVVVDHWHGITVMGAKNIKILNNTVFDPTDKKPGPAWIRITNHKKGNISSGNLVANNLTHSYSFPDGGVMQLQNQIIRNPYDLFVDPDNHDYRLKKRSRAVNAGMDGLGVDEDFFGNPRPSGSKTDVGAVEFQQ